MVEWLGITQFRVSGSSEEGGPVKVTDAHAVRRADDGSVGVVHLTGADKSDDNRYSYEHVGVASDYRDREDLVGIEARETESGEVRWRQYDLDEEGEE